MKKYDTETVTKVLSNMDEKGFRVYKLYYLADTLFIIAFGLLQIVLLRASFSWVNQPILVNGLCIIPIIRGVADMVENTILFTTLCRFPVVSDTWIKVSSTATSIKLLMIKLWIVAIIIGIGGRVFKHFRMFDKVVKKYNIENI